VRITLDIDDDVLAAAREIARVQRRRSGKVISELVRKGLRQSSTTVATTQGVPHLTIQPDAKSATLKSIKELDQETR
jgi:hypothetical protein